MKSDHGTSSPLLLAEELALAPANWRLFDARSGAAGRDAFRQGHLEDAIHADLDRDLAAPADDPARGGRHPLPEIPKWAETLGRWGLTPDSAIAIYDDQGGANAAARMWWLLRASGHSKVAVIDGGFQAAVSAGVATSTDVPNPDPAPPYPVTEWQLPTVDLDEVDRSRSDPRCTLVDVRSAERFRGEVEPFDPRKGRIPGAVNLPYTSLLDSQGRFLERPPLSQRLDALLPQKADPAGDPDSRPVIVHCGSGVTACHTLLAMELAGRDPGALYVGSWSEWCRAKTEEIEVG